MVQMDEDGYGRSIPAHAGEPVPHWAEPRPVMVYPRPRGGTAGAGNQSAHATGLSPPTRGNPSSRTTSTSSRRSIPAHAGEPVRDAPRRRIRAVYPRPRGGTPSLKSIAYQMPGLSQPTRGNPARRRAVRARVRSIPAHAGEPLIAQGVNGADGVYPRPRGGTPPTSSRMTSISGLSPPTRGNLPAALRSAPVYRSIPAHAGEPGE